MKRTKLAIPLTLVLALLVSGCSAPAQKQAPAQPAVSIQDSADGLNYSIGHQIGRDLVRQKTELRPDVLLQGIRDAKEGVEPRMKFDRMVATLAAYKEQIVQSAEGEATRARRLGEQFLNENTTKPGVTTLPSGLQYKVLKQGTGPKPNHSSTVKVNYIGRKIDATIFSGTYQGEVSTPVEIAIEKVIPAWEEALLMMPVGSKWELYVPHNLAFKDTGPLAGQTVIFEVELLDIVAGK